MNRQQLLAVVEDTWRQLDAAIDGLDEAAMAEPGVVEAWSIKDLLGHIVTWEQMAVGRVDRWRRGESLVDPNWSSTDDYNAGEAARRHDWPLARIREEQAATRQQLRTTLESLTDDEWITIVGEDQLRGPLGDWIGGDLGGAGPGTHAAEHAQHIRAWRDARERRRAEQLAELIAARRELLRAIDGLSEDDLTVATEGEWSIRDALAHIAAWDRLMVACIAAWLDGAAPPEPSSDVDAFNAQAAAQARAQPPAATLIGLARAHEDLLAAVERANGRGGTFQYTDGTQGDLRRAADETAAHEHEHTEQIVAWRDQ
jgi:hypothetical protein